MNDKMTGQTILYFKLLKKLGEGGMGIVYLAEDTRLERKVAIKFLHHYINSDSENKERFRIEARTAASLNHPNIAQIYSIEEADEDMFIVMEYVKGKELADIINENQLPINLTINYAIQIAEGLSEAHKKGIIHRDIKSSNIMITGENRIKIMDFGLAKIRGGKNLTSAGTTIGTTAYMSPEQARGEDLDNRTDIWAFGVVLYEMLAGRLPFAGDYEQATVYLILNEEPQPIVDHNYKVSQELQRIVLKSLAKDKNERYQSIDEIIADLRHEKRMIKDSQTGKTKPSKPGHPDYSELYTSKKVGGFKIVLPLVIIILLAAAFFVFNPFKTNEAINPAKSADRNSIAVMYFRNIPNPSDKNHTGDMLTNLLITSLSQVKGLDVISRDRLLAIEKDMGQTDSDKLSPSVSMKIAKQAGVNTMLTGSILQTEPRLAVTTNLINVQTGEVIGSQQLTNFSGSQIFNLVDSLSVMIQNNLQVSSNSPQEVKSVADVTTKYPEAYRAYVEGLNLRSRFFWKEANSAFEQAINLDPEFAMAYYQLYNTENVLGETDVAEKDLNKAVELSDKTTERERLQILAANYGVQNNFKKLIETDNQLIRSYPRETFPYVSLGFLTDDHILFDPQKGVDILKRGADINPNAKNIWNALAYSQAYLNDKRDALNSVNHYINLAPAEPNPYDSKGDIYAWFMDYDSSRSAYQHSFSLRDDFDAYKLGYYAILNQKYTDAQKYFQISGYSIGIFTGGIVSKVAFPLIEIGKGQLKYSYNKLSDILNSKLSQGERRFALYEMTHVSYELAQYSDMLKYAKELSVELHKNPGDKIYGRVYVAWALAKNGKPRKAKNLIKEMKKDINLTLPVSEGVINYISALVAFEEGKFNTALQGFSNFEHLLPPNHEPNIYYAVCLLKCEQTAEAVRELRRLTQWPGTIDLYLWGTLPGENFNWPIQSVIAHYWLGVAYEKIGEKEKSLKEYKTFLKIWKNADFTSPELKDAEIQVRKLERLAAK